MIKLPDRNPAFDPNFVLPVQPIGQGNDYRHILEHSSLFVASGQPYTQKVSIIIPVCQQRQGLANLLATLTQQTYPKELTEIIVIDDDNQNNTLKTIKKYQRKLTLRYVWQPPSEKPLPSARNLGSRCAQGDALVFISTQIIPPPTAIEHFMRILHVADDTILLGHIRCKESNSLVTAEQYDWRYPEYTQNNHLINSLSPFHFLTDWNFALSHTLFKRVGGFSEKTTERDSHISEFAYRTYNAGAYFIPILEVECFYQKPKSKKPSREKWSSHHVASPKVSILIRAYNAERYIVSTVQSCLTQDFSDLEVCIVDDGSTDNTLPLLTKYFANDARVHWVSQPKSGRGKAGNAALKLCQGMYIGQLEGNDLLKPKAVSACVAILDEYLVDGVYTDYEIIDIAGNYIRDGWCNGSYNRNWLLTNDIYTPFCMLRRQTLSRTGGFNEILVGAEDFDLFLKVTDRATLFHLHEFHYCQRWHGSNVSIIQRQKQQQNYVQASAACLQRLGLDIFWNVQVGNTEKGALHTIQITPKSVKSSIAPTDIFILIPICTEQLQQIGDELRSRLQAMRLAGFRYLFVIGKADTRGMEVKQDILYVPCEDTEISAYLQLAFSCLFLYRQVTTRYVCFLEHQSVPDIRYFLNKLLPKLKGQPFYPIIQGNFLRWDLLPLLFNDLEYAPYPANKHYIEKKRSLKHIMQHYAKSSS